MIRKIVFIIGIIVASLYFIGCIPCVADQNDPSILYLDEYRDNDRYIPTEDEVIAFAKAKAQENGDQVLEISCMLSTHYPSVVWNVQIVGCQASTGRVYYFNTQVEVYVGELFMTPPMNEYTCERYLEFDNLNEYYEYKKTEKRWSDLTLQWTELYGPYFTWNLELKSRYCAITKRLPYRPVNTGIGPEIKEFTWTLPENDMESFTERLKEGMEAARNLVIQYYQISEEDFSNLEEDIQCRGPFYNLSFTYWTKACLGGAYYWIPLCSVSPVVYDMKTGTTGPNLRGLDKKIISCFH